MIERNLINLNRLFMEASCLNTLFSNRSMSDLAEKGTCEAFQEAVARFVPNAKLLSNGEALACVFSFMKYHYRNEYVYKSLLLKKTVYGRYSPRTTSALCELPVADSIADFVLINSKACVYEIKTDLDNLSRLKMQIQDYYRAFRYVSVVCSEQTAKGVFRLIENFPVGLTILTDRLTLKTIREPACFDGTLEPGTQFDLLRKAERESVLSQCGEELPNTTPVRYYEACLRKFMQIDPTKRITVFEKVLKERGSSINQGALSLYPEEFKLVAYNHGASFEQAERLREFTQSHYR